MSSLLEKIAEKGLEQVKERGPEWVEKLVEEGRELLPPNQGDGAVIYQQGMAALDWLEANKDKVAHKGLLGLQAFAGYVALGDGEKATLVWLAHGADWDDLHNAVDGAADRVEQAAIDKAEALAFAKSLGAAAAKALLPILMAINPIKLPL
jgi:hypothetical protein